MPPPIIKYILKELKAEVKASARDDANWPSRLMTRQGDASITIDEAIQRLSVGTISVPDLESYHLIGFLRGYFALYEIDIVGAEMFVTLDAELNNCKPSAFPN